MIAPSAADATARGLLQGLPPDQYAFWQSIIEFGMLMGLKIVVFIIGYLTIRLGYNLILSGAKGEFKFSGKFFGLNTNLASVSPGLLFVLLGVILIGYAMAVNKSFETHYSKPPGADKKTDLSGLPDP